jgi:hypothetical protein
MYNDEEKGMDIKIIEWAMLIFIAITSGLVTGMVIFEVMQGS